MIGYFVMFAGTNIQTNEDVAIKLVRNLMFLSVLTFICISLECNCVCSFFIIYNLIKVYPW